MMDCSGVFSLIVPSVLDGIEQLHMAADRGMLTQTVTNDVTGKHVQQSFEKGKHITPPCVGR